MIRFQLLGPVDLLRGDGAPVDSILTQPKRLALLAYLAAARPRGLHRRDALLALFWPELGESQGRAALRQALFFLRRSLGPDVLPGRGAEEVGVDRDLLRTDVEEVERALELALTGAAADAPDARSAAEQALETLVERPLMDAFHVQGIPDFERWLEGERSRLLRLARDAAARLVSRAEAAGSVDAALRSAILRLRLDPLDEPAARHLIELKLDAGDRGGAVQVWQAFDARWRRELGMSPTFDAPSPVEVGERARAAAAPDPGDGEDAPSPTEETPSDGSTAEERLVVPSRSEGRPPRRRRPRPTVILAGAFALALAVSLGSLGRTLTEPAPADPPPVAPTRMEGQKGILWVDDNPESNRIEQARLRARGVGITVAVSTDEALAVFDPMAFQLVISDIGRYKDGTYQSRAGLDLLDRLRGRGDSVPVIFYTSAAAVSNLQGEAAARGAAGITASMEELFVLIGPGG